MVPRYGTGKLISNSGAVRYRPKPCKGCGGEFTPSTPNSQYCRPEHKPKQRKEYFQEYHRANRDRKILKASQWYQENKTRKQEYDARRRLEKSEEIAEGKRQYQKRLLSEMTEEELKYHRRRNAEKSNSRRVRKTGNGSFKVTERDLRRQILRQGNRCYYCHEELTEASKLEWDHLVPVIRGGSHSIGNLVASCRKCNRRKARRTFMEFRLLKVVSPCNV